MRIDDYSFGRMTINGKDYDSDLIIFPDKIKPNWWRNFGHTLLIEDLVAVIEYKPKFLVVGTGAAGVMKVPAKTKQEIAAHNIELISQVTPKAYKTFNDYIQKGEKVVGAFHLTC
jgi:hypothetical protein